MSTSLLSSRRTRAGLLSLLVGATLMLGACGSNDPDPVVPPPVVTPPVVVTPPPVAVDAFVTQVTTTAATPLDVNEPASIDALVATMPEDTEPAPVS